MPLLYRKPFVGNQTLSTLKPDDKVFYCQLTNEAFTDYEEYWNRVLLCNAMVWTCSITGCPNLTYEEAVACEAKARKSLTSISPALARPLIFLGSLTHRGKFADMSDDIFYFARDHYFVDEEVDAIVGKHWYDCKVTRVYWPTKEDIEKYHKEMADSEDEIEDIQDNDSDIQIVKVVNKSSENDEYPPYATFKYEVLEILDLDFKECKKHIVSWDQIRRNKSAFTREKCKLFLKQYVQLSIQGYWEIKPDVLKKANVIFEEIFTAGKLPKFVEGKAKKVCNSPDSKMKEEKLKERKKKKEEKERKKREQKELDENTMKKKRRQPLSEEEKQAHKKMVLDAKMEIREEKKMERDLKKEERRLLDRYIKEWSTVREDLELGDHKDLPMPLPVDCRIPSNLFGEFVMVLEFMNVFKEMLEIADVYPHGITFDMLVHAIVEPEIAGVLNDVFQLLLDAIFTLQREEDEEIKDTTVHFDSTRELERDDTNADMLDAVKLANSASTWSQVHLGVPLQKAPLDALTLTEILRLHLLASGSNNIANSKWRYFNRGGYKNWDDPGFQLKIDNPSLLRAMSVTSVFNLAMSEKLTILKVLIHQILTYASARDIIDEKFDKLKEMKNSLKVFQSAECQKVKEENSLRWLKKKEKRQRKIDLLIKKCKKNAAVMNGVAVEKLDGRETKEVGECEEDEEEKKLQEEKEDKLRERRKAEYHKKEKEHVKQILQIIDKIKKAPLGQDRAFRNYWLFDSIQGLFVEQNDMPGECFENPTPVGIDGDPLKDEFVLNAVKEQALRNINACKDEKNHSDIENENGLSIGKRLSDSNINGAIIDQTGHAKLNGVAKDNISSDHYKEQYCKKLEYPIINTFSGKRTDIGGVFGLCTATVDCPVHKAFKDQPKWSFFYKESDFEALVENLNIRGERESSLKEALEEFKDLIENSMKNSPVYKLNSLHEPEVEGIRKSQRKFFGKKDDPNFNFPPRTPIDLILDATLRDMILEIENKIYLGLLGSLNIQDREQWRNKFMEDNLVPLDQENFDWAGSERIKKLKLEFGLDINSNESEDDLDSFAGHQTPKILAYAQAILQVEQSLDTKYLTTPLGENEKAKKKRKKAEVRLKNFAGRKTADQYSDTDSDDENIKECKISNNALRTPVERWERSLKYSTSYSQLYLHLTSLENCISWSSSALNVRCRLCQKRNDPENMLLCDGCDKGHHIYCLKPKLKAIPTGDWFCIKCKPKEKPKNPRKQRKIYKEESEDEEEEDDENNSNKTSETASMHGEFCSMCQDGGKLVCCDTCPLSYHLKCANLKKVPAGTWECPECVKPLPRVTRNSPQNNNQKGKDEKKKAETERLKRKRDIIEEPLEGTKRMRLENGDTLKKSGRRSLVDRNSDFNRPALQTLLHNLLHHESAWPFVRPVTKEEVPDYFDIIKKPMDFSLIQAKLNENQYNLDTEFIGDVLLVFQNCKLYNKTKSDEYIAGESLAKYFTKRLKEIGHPFTVDGNLVCHSSVRIAKYPDKL